MLQEITIRITGEAGQGMQTIGRVLCGIFKSAGYHIFACQDFMSRIRGGNNFFDLRVSTRPVYSPRHNQDLILCLDKASVEIHRKALAPEGIIFIDGVVAGNQPADENTCYTAFGEISRRIANELLYMNSVACGLIAGITGIDFSYVKEGIEEAFAKKSDIILRNNINTCRAGFELGIENPAKSCLRLSRRQAPQQARSGLFLTVQRQWHQAPFRRA